MFDLASHIKGSLDQSIIVNYYAILNITPQSSLPQLCQNYRDIALATHPALQHQNPNEAYRKFAQAAEAFDVLYDPEKKRIYDQFGEHKLKEGVLKDQQLIGKYKFTTDPQEVFQKFFGSKNVFEHLLDANPQGQSHPIFTSQYQSLNPTYQVPHLVVPVECTLTQLFNGCTKTVSYDRKVLTADGKNSQFVKESKVVTISPGESPRQPLVYPELGNEVPGYKRSMLVFNIVEVNQKQYRRQDDALIYTAKISLMDALDSKSITVPQLNGQLLNLHFDQIISPQTSRVIPNKGMPIKGRDGQRGDLIVKFDIQFPEELDFEKKRRVIQLLKQERQQQ